MNLRHVSSSYGGNPQWVRFDVALPEDPHTDQMLAVRKQLRNFVKAKNHRLLGADAGVTTIHHLLHQPSRGSQR